MLGYRKLNTAPALRPLAIGKSVAVEKKIEEQQFDIKKSLDRLVSPVTRGDPESALRWTCKSTYQLKVELNHQGYQVCSKTIGRLLKEVGYSLQSPRKTDEGGKHEDRDAQFNFINSKVESFQVCGKPTLSVDTKKKENIGNYANKGKEYQPKGQPDQVKVYDFIDKKKGIGGAEPLRSGARSRRAERSRERAARRGRAALHDAARAARRAGAVPRVRRRRARAQAHAVRAADAAVSVRRLIAARRRIDPTVTSLRPARRCEPALRW